MILRNDSYLGDILEEIEETQELNPVQELVELIFYFNPLFNRHHTIPCFDLIEFKDETFYEKTIDVRPLSGYSIIRVEKKLNGTSDAFNIDEFDPSNIDPDNSDFVMDLDELPDLDDYFEDPDLFEYEEDDDFNEEDWD